jgi:hypothetical protein
MQKIMIKALGRLFIIMVLPVYSYSIAGADIEAPFVLLESGSTLATLDLAGMRLVGGDVDGDSHNELILFTQGRSGRGGRLDVLNTTGGERLFSMPLESVKAAAAGDWDGDGIDEIMVLQRDAVQVLFWRGKGLDEGPILDLGWGEPLALACGDIDGDGRDEIAVALDLGMADLEVRPSSVVVWGGGVGGMEQMAYVEAGRHVGAMCLGDMNGDGMAELIFEQGGEEMGGMVQVYDFSTGQARLVAQSQLSRGHQRVLGLSAAAGWLGAADSAGRVSLWKLDGKGLRRESEADLNISLKTLFLGRSIAGGIELIGAGPLGLWRWDGSGF